MTSTKRSWTRTWKEASINGIGQRKGSFENQLYFHTKPALTVTTWLGDLDIGNLSKSTVVAPRPKDIFLWFCSRFLFFISRWCFPTCSCSHLQPRNEHELEIFRRISRFGTLHAILGEYYEIYLACIQRLWLHIFTTGRGKTDKKIWDQVRQGLGLERLAKSGVCPQKKAFSIRLKCLYREWKMEQGIPHIRKISP